MFKILVNTKTKIYLTIVSIFILMLIIKSTPYCEEILQLNKIGYSLNSSNIIYKNKNYNYIKNNSYNEIVDKYIKNDNFNDNYIDKYYQINYVDIDNFIVIINSLIEKGYLVDDINNILTNYDKSLINYLLINKVDNISKYLEYRYFNSQNIDRYLKYFNGSYKETIINVNIGLDKEYYENSIIVSEYNKNMIVNKYHKLNNNFVPKRLKKIKKCSNGNHYLTKEAKEAFEKLCEASKLDGMSISVNSAYRSYTEQEDIYNYYLKTFGKSYVENFVAIPGFSEHQTGLALDIVSLDSNSFIYTKEYNWMVLNAHKYGFILRYPENKKHITGYNGEAWHFRYVGVEPAKYMYENDLTYEEYYAITYK